MSICMLQYRRSSGIAFTDPAGALELHGSTLQGVGGYLPMEVQV